MTPINETSLVKRHRRALTEMMSSKDPSEFRIDWITSHAWKVVPVESMARLPPAEIPRLVAVLRRAGFQRCIALPTESAPDLKQCYEVSIDEADFGDLNRELGVFRFVLTDSESNWAISCTEWYNLFAGAPHLLSELLGKSIEAAREDYRRYLAELTPAGGRTRLQEIADRYAEL